MTTESKAEQIKDLHTKALETAKEARRKGDLFNEGHALGEAAGLRQALEIYGDAAAIEELFKKEG